MLSFLLDISKISKNLKNKKKQILIIAKIRFIIIHIITFIIINRKI